MQLRTCGSGPSTSASSKDRRSAILSSVAEQGKLDGELCGRIEAAPTKQALEDLYLSYRPKRRTRATIARERGLESLAELIWAGADNDAQVEAAPAGFLDARRPLISSAIASGSA